MSNELVIIEETTALAAFVKSDGLDPIIQQARDAVSEFDHDMKTAASRKRTAALANKVAKLKVRLDDMGKDLVSDWKNKAKVVDASRKAMRDELDSLKHIARKPLSDWEAEQAEIELAKIAEQNKLDQERDHEMGLLINADFDRQLAARLAEECRLEHERQARVEQERIERETEMKRQAAEQARIEAENKAAEQAAMIEQQKQDAIKREQAAIEAQKESERQRIASEERAKIQAEQAELRRIEAEKQAAINAEQAASAARQAEIDRQKAEAENSAEEDRKRQANIEHCRSICTAAKNDLIKAGLTEEMAVLAIKAIRANEISHTSIKF